MKKIEYPFINSIFSILYFIFTNNSFVVDVQISLFYLDNYDQYMDQWFFSENSGYNKSLLSSACQKQCLQESYNYLYFINTRSFSTWGKNCIHKILNQQPDLKTLEENLIEWYNKNKDPNYVNYGENFCHHILKWINDSYENINTNQFSKLEYNENNRVIIVTNLNERVLPIDGLHFYNFILAGQEYPFDNLQISSLREETPDYIVAQLKDKVWGYIVTPSFIAWVHGSSITPIPEGFYIRYISGRKPQKTWLLLMVKLQFSKNM